MDPKSVCLAHFPFPYITIPFWTFPKSTSVLKSLSPLAIINFSIYPLKLTFPVFQVILIWSLVAASVRLYLYRNSRSLSLKNYIYLIIIPTAFVNSIIFINQNSKTLFFIIFKGTKIDSVFFNQNRKIRF